jgi:hypothetical protein
MEIKKPRTKFCSLDTSILGLTGLVGIIACYLTFFSEHPLVGHNYNILWLMPLNLAAGIMLWFRSMRIALFFYFSVLMLLIIFAFSIYSFDVQAINFAFLPIMLTLSLICAGWIIRCRRAFKRKTNKSKSFFSRN